MPSASGAYAMKSWRQAGFCILALVPVLVLGVASLPHIADGQALEAAIPVPNYMVQRLLLPQAAYASAHVALQGVDWQDGAGIITGAEAALQSGIPPQTQVAPLRQGLMRQPASTRGWVLLAEAALPVDRQLAAAALGQALLLGPRDYFLAGLRVQYAALLWPELDAFAQRSALAQTQLLWDEESLRPQLRIVLAAPGGVAIVAKAFADRRDDIRAMNRWLSVQRMRRKL